MVGAGAASDGAHGPPNSADKFIPATRLGVLPAIADTVEAVAPTCLPALDLYLAPP